MLLLLHHSCLQFFSCLQNSTIKCFGRRSKVVLGGRGCVINERISLPLVIGYPVGIPTIAFGQTIVRRNMGDGKCISLDADASSTIDTLFGLVVIDDAAAAAAIVATTHRNTKVPQGQSVEGPRVLFVNVRAASKTIRDRQGRKTLQKLRIVALHQFDGFSGHIPEGSKALQFF